MKKKMQRSYDYCVAKDVYFDKAAVVERMLGMSGKRSKREGSGN
jgi:hypothetical protein